MHTSRVSSVASAETAAASHVNTRQVRLTRSPMSLELPSLHQACSQGSLIGRLVVNHCMRVQGSTRSCSHLTPGGSPVPAEHRGSGEVQLRQDEERNRQVGRDPWVEPVLGVGLQL